MESPVTDGYDFTALAGLLGGARTKPDLYQRIVNTPFEFPLNATLLFLGIVVLLLVDEDKGTVNRIALSETAQAEATKEVSVKPFESIRIPLSAEDNSIVQAIKTGHPTDTTDWATLFTPVLTPEQSRINQANGGIGYSAIYPVSTDSIKAALIFSYYNYPENISEAQSSFMQHYADLVGKHLA